jgi:hypothetical protein
LDDAFASAVTAVARGTKILRAKTYHVALLANEGALPVDELMLRPAVTAEAEAPVRALAPNIPALPELTVVGTAGIGGRGEYFPDESISPGGQEGEEGGITRDGRQDWAEYDFRST